jgi:hypothetical protein
MQRPGSPSYRCHVKRSKKLAPPAAALAVIFVLAVTPAARADSVLAGRLPLGPKVSAGDNAIAWSTFSADGWHLMARVGQATEAVPVAPSPDPFDVDLGDDGHGGLVASYSRCSVPAEGLQLPHGCHLYYYDFATRTEHRVTLANTAGRSQFDPSMAAGRIAFVQIDDRLTVGPRNQPRIYVQGLNGGKPKLMPGGLQNGDDRTGPTALDLSGKALAFSWSMHGSGPDGLGYGDTELHVDQLAGGQAIIDRHAGGNLSGVTDLSPTLFSGALYYGEAVTGDTTEYTFRALGLSDGRATMAPAPLGLESVSTGALGTIYSRCETDVSGGQPTGPPCEVRLIEKVTYVDADRELAQVGRPTTISAAPGRTSWVAWSAYDAQARDYSLMLRRPDGGTFAAPVPRRRVPFDVQLGPRPRGGFVAVYSRCRVEPRLDPNDHLPLPATGRGCRLYRYDIGSARERRIPGSGSRFLPSVWNGELAFALLGANGRPALFLGSLDGRAAVRRLSTGAAGNAVGLGPRAIVLRGARMAFVWERRTRSGLRSELRLLRLGRGTGLIDAVNSRSGAARELSPFFSEGTLDWARRDTNGNSRLKVFTLVARDTKAYLLPAPIHAVAAYRLRVSPYGPSETLFYSRAEDNGDAVRLMSGRYFPALRR